MIKSRDLENQMAGDESGIRRRKGQAVLRAASTEVEQAYSEAMQDIHRQLDELKRRLAAARALQPPKSELHCPHCWGTGRDAVLKIIDQG